MDITQVEAAAKLDWTQGAFSQYLNDITEMSPQTIIKLANFLGVPPSDIDPNIDNSLPNVQKKEARYNLGDPNKLICETVKWNPKQDDFVINVTETKKVKVNGQHYWFLHKGMMLTVIDVLSYTGYIPRMSTNVPFYLVQKVNSDEFEMYGETTLPADDTLAKKFLISDITVY